MSSRTNIPKPIKYALFGIWGGLAIAILVYIGYTAFN
jgi:hypothetical protein